MLRRTAVIIVASLAWATGHSDPSAQTQGVVPPARPVFRAGVEAAYVAAAVVVTDKNGKPVQGLTRADFEILERGVRQTILDFDYISIPVNNRSVDLRAEPGPEPDVASNPPATRTGRVFVFLIDDGALKAQDLVPFKRVMTDFLKKLTPDDEAAVVYVKRSDLGSDFTRDVGQLIRGVNDITAAIGWGPDAHASKLVLDNVIGTLATAPQTRRAIVYVGGGFAICAGAQQPPCTTGNNRWAAEDLVRLFERARYADVPIYTIDPQGLESAGDPLMFSGSMENQTPERRRSQVTRNINRGWQQFLLTVAGATGGLGFVQQSNLSSAVNKIMADNGSYYALGYSPSPFVADGRFHPLNVRIVSRPDLQVRTRQGYLASRAAVASDPVAAAMDLLADGQPQSDLALRAFAAPVAITPDGTRTVVTVDVEYPAPASGEAREDDQLQVVLLAIDTEADVKFSAARTRGVAFTQADTGAITVSLGEIVDLPKGRLTLRIGVSSRLLGRTGTVHLPVEVRSLSGKGPTPTPLVVGLVDGPASLNTVARPDAFVGLVPFEPSTRRTFSRDEDLRLFSRVFGENPAGITAEFRLRSGKKVVRAVAARTESALDMTNALDCEAELSLKDLPAGSYILEFSARRGRDEPAERAVAIQIQ